MDKKAHEWGKGVVRLLEELQNEGFTVEGELKTGISVDFPTLDSWLDFCYGVISVDKKGDYLKHLSVPNSKKELIQKAFEQSILEGSSPGTHISLLVPFTQKGFLNSEKIIHSISNRLKKIGSHDSMEINSTFRALYELHKTHPNEVEQLFSNISIANKTIFPLLGTFKAQGELFDDDKFSLAFGIYIIVKYIDKFENSPTINQEFDYIREILVSPSKHKEILKNYIDILIGFNDISQLFIKQASSSEEYKIWLQEAFKAITKRNINSLVFESLLKVQEAIPSEQWWALLKEQNIIIQFMFDEVEQGKKFNPSTNLLNGIILHAKHLHDSDLQEWPQSWYKLPLGLQNSDLERFVDVISTVIQQRILNGDYAYRMIRVYGKSLIESGFLQKRAEEFVELMATIITRNQGEELQWTKNILVADPTFFDNVPPNRYKYLVDISKSVLHSPNLPDFGANGKYWPEALRRELLEEIINILDKCET